MARIALVEDDSAISELVRYNLAADGNEVSVHRDGESFLLALSSPTAIPPELLLLDVMLPGVDGYGVLEALRRHPTAKSVPVLMLTARGTEAEKVRGLEAGADDYLSKPFGLRELLARVHALLRRGGPVGSPSRTTPDQGPDDAELPSSAEASHPGVLRGFGGVTLDNVRHRVFRGEEEVLLTHREFELLRYLVAGAGVAYSRDELLRHVWGFEFTGETRTVDVHVRQLRLKLRDTDPDAPLIETVRGRGYRYRETVS
jgi:two-component system alkaline phosphatase synthesis response regulator PhoP